MKILFVDDESRVRRSVKRILKEKMGGEKLYVAGSGKEALELIGKMSVDVVMSDMHMPEMSGAELLSEVKKFYPEVIRIIMSDYSEHKNIMKKAPSAHKFISKPIDSKLLKKTLMEAYNLRQMLGKNSVVNMFSDTDGVPEPPNVYKKLSEKMSEDNFSLKDIGDIIEEDMEVATDLIKLAHSEFFDLPVRITRIEHAVNYLGIDIIKNLILFASVFNSTDFSSEDIPNMSEVRDHSVKTGRIAGRICLERDKKDEETAEKAMIAGIVHDIGKILLAGKKKKNSVSYDIPLWNMTRKQECDLFDLSHQEAGAYILRDWSVEDDIVEAVACHHNPSEASASSEFSVLTALHIAEAVVTRLETGNKKTFDLDYLSRVGMDASTIKKVVEYHREITEK